MYRIVTGFIIVLFLLSSCQKDFTQPTTNVQNLDISSELLPHFEAFQKEASSYGITVDYERAGVTAEIESINRGSVAGTCTTNGHDLRHITIDQSFWSRASHLTREMIIFHELGHCVLGRGHEEGTFENGICRSIMRSGLGDCHDAYNGRNREYFVEELFLGVD